MNLTAYDKGRSPVEMFAARRRPDGRKPMSAAERKRRNAIAQQARATFPSMCAMARHLGLPSGAVCQWLNDVRPVPAKHLSTLERIAGGEA